MTTAQIMQLVALVANIATLLFVAYYFLGLRRREKDIQKKEAEMTTGSRQVMDNALAREKQLLDNATAEANQIIQVATTEAQQIIAGAQTISKMSKETIDAAMQKLVVDIQGIGSTTQLTVEQAMQKMVVDIQKEAMDSSHTLMGNYATSLKQVATTSLTDFSTVAKGLEVDLQRQINEFNQTLLPALQKQLEEYKQARLKQTEETISRIVQRASQEVMNKSISVIDHQSIMLEALEKAKKEGLFS